MAADASRGVRSLFVPPEFSELCSLLTAADAATRSLDASMRRVIADEGWPPPLAARRTRVQTDGTLECHRCRMRFSKHWCFRGVCWQCEGVLRASGTCPYESAASRANKRGSAASQHCFCTHQLKCAVCDGGFAPCPICRLARGDGERCVELCAELAAGGGAAAEGGRGAAEGVQALPVFLDFDRTLCSTKAGRSPLLGRHTLDADLASLAAVHPTTIVTRNPHREAIEAFLAERGVPICGVRVVPSKLSKAEVMAQLLREGGGGGQGGRPVEVATPPERSASALPSSAPPGAVHAVFIDDDVRELTRPDVVRLPLLRVPGSSGARGCRLR